MKNNTISKITDESGRRIELKTDPDGYLSEMINWNGERVSYEYDEGYLKKITGPGERSVEYAYDSDGALISVTVSGSGTMNLGYSPLSSGKQVNLIEERGTDGTLGQTLRMSRGYYNQTAVISSGVDNIRYSDDDITTRYEFDNAGRVTAVYSYTQTEELGVDALSFSSAAAKEDSSDIRKLNRIMRMGGCGATTDNLLTNHSAESTSGWTSEKSSSVSASFSMSSAQHLFGNRSFRISVSQSGREGRAAYSQIHEGDIKASTTYTMSGYVKTQNIIAEEDSAPAGAVLMVKSENASGSSEHVSEYILKTSDEEVNEGWRRISVTFTTEADAERIRAGMAIINATGTAYFDGLQLEEGSTLSAYNMIENPSFEKKNGSFV